jgi:NTE family protein
VAAVEYRLGLVLSGGGSRGLAHVGVLRALAEAGIEPECAAGTSSGALIGALWAAGHAPDEMLEFFAVANPFRLSRVAPLRKPGLIDSEKIVEDFRRWFPEDSFEALRRPLWVTATDLVSGQLELFSSGPLIRPLLASCSVPVVITPTEVGGGLYADGGILDNFPVEPLETRCERVLGVYASPLREADAGRLTSSLAISQRALEIGMYHASARRFDRAQFVLCPPELARYATFDTRRHREIAEIGYRAAIESMEEIRAAVAPPA